MLKKGNQDSTQIFLQTEAVREKIWKKDYGSHLQSIWLPTPHSFKDSAVHSSTFYMEEAPGISPVLSSKSRKKLSSLYFD